MKKKIGYTPQTRETLIAEQKALGFRLIEDQAHFDGNWLIFDDEKPERDFAAEIDGLKVRVETMEKR